ncbi:MAG: hypothetical protein ACJA01_004084, partial [Saprospiraceae bacterium]
MFACIFTYSCQSKSAAIAQQSGKIDYNFHIRPILSDRCFKCHGPDANQREANLRLDTPEGAYAALEEDPNSYVVVSGDLAASHLYQRLTSDDLDLKMPPPESNLALDQSEIDLIARWIEQGAEYKKHWAFLSPEQLELPSPEDAWPKKGMDHFVLAKMQEQGLEPNPK